MPFKVTHHIKKESRYPSGRIFMASPDDNSTDRNPSDRGNPISPAGALCSGIHRQMGRRSRQRSTRKCSCASSRRRRSIARRYRSQQFYRLRNCKICVSYETIIETIRDEICLNIVSNTTWYHCVLIFLIRVKTAYYKNQQNWAQYLHIKIIERPDFWYEYRRKCDIDHHEIHRLCTISIRFFLLAEL